MSTEDVSGSDNALYDSDGHVSLHVFPNPLNGWRQE